VRDTRLVQVRELAADIETLTGELLEEGVPDVQEMLHVASMAKLASAIVSRASQVYTEPLR
jgi:hypothetical protein